MPLMQMVVTLAVLGVVLWAINNYIPMQKNIKNILNVVVVVAVSLYVLNAFGVLGSTSRFQIRRW